MFLAAVAVALDSQLDSVSELNDELRSKTHNV